MSYGQIIVMGSSHLGRWREQMALPIKPHYGEQWSNLYFEVVNKVKKVFQTKNDLFIFAAISSSAMEAIGKELINLGANIVKGVAVEVFKKEFER